MSRPIVLLALLLISLQGFGQSADQNSPAIAMRPVKQLARQNPSSAEISFMSFEFEQLHFTHHPGTFAIDGEPTRGFRYFIEAKLYGEEAIATAKFEAVDAVGNVIQQILIDRLPSPSGSSGFYGVMRVPDRPFRIVVSGQGIDGRRYRRTYKRLFRPTNKRKSPVLIPPGRTPIDAKSRQQFEAVAQELLDKTENDLKKNAGKMIVMPQTRVSNVMYAPYLSKAGRPLGIRIQFDVEFSQDGYYNPELHLFPFYQNEDWRSLIDMKPLTGNIEPLPAEPGSPQMRPHILAYGTDYVYRGRTTYHFTAELIPDYALQNEKKTKFCIYYEKYKYSPGMQAAWKAILASKAPTKYRLFINNTNFAGEIEGLHPQGGLLESFVSEGAKDCGEQPTTRF